MSGKYIEKVLVSQPNQEIYDIVADAIEQRYRTYAKEAKRTTFVFCGVTNSREDLDTARTAIIDIEGDPEWEDFTNSCVDYMFSDQCNVNLFISGIKAKIKCIQLPL